MARDFSNTVMATHNDSDPFFARMLGHKLLERRQQTREVFNIPKVPENRQSISVNGETNSFVENSENTVGVKKTTIEHTKMEANIGIEEDIFVTEMQKYS